MSLDLPHSMLAARVTAPNTFASFALVWLLLKPTRTEWEIQTVPVPRPKGAEALVKVGAAGLCHTDTMIMEFSMFGVYPVTGSHEPAGTVVALGEDAERRGTVQIGDRVAGLQHFGMCHKCRDCTEYSWKYCAESSYMGLTGDGAFAEYVLLEAECLVPIPDDMPFEQAAPLTCAGVTMWTAIRDLKLQPGQVIGISGLGALGSLGVQFAKAIVGRNIYFDMISHLAEEPFDNQGLVVVGIDARPEPIESTRQLKLAPDLLINAAETSAEEARKQIAQLRPPGYKSFAEPFNGVDAMILTADPAPAQRYAVDITQRHGKFMVVAQPETLAFSFRDFVFRDLTVIGSLQGDVNDLRETIELAHTHGIVSDVVTYTIDQHKDLLGSVHGNTRKGKSVMVFP